MLAQSNDGGGQGITNVPSIFSTGATGYIELDGGGKMVIGYNNQARLAIAATGTLQINDYVGTTIIDADAHLLKQNSTSGNDIWDSEGTASNGLQIVNWQTMTNHLATSIGDAITNNQPVVSLDMITNTGAGYIDLSGGTGMVIGYNNQARLAIAATGTLQINDYVGNLIIDADAHLLKQNSTSGNDTWESEGTASNGLQIVN